MQRYRLGRELHRGRVASIFEAQIEGDAGFRRPIALKLLHADASDGEQESFADEADILSRIRHSNVIAAYDFGTLDGRPYLAMELVAGVTAERAAERRLPIEAALYVVREIALALAHAHELGVIHRDVTPHNLLLGFDGSVRLCDFGIAFAPKRRNPTTVGIGKGTPGYLPPEQLTGSAADARTDVFALGCVLHRLLAGASPALDPTRIEIRADLPKLALSIVRRAVQSAPKDRHQTAAELGLAAADALTELGAQDPRAILMEHLAPLAAPAAVVEHPLIELFGEPPPAETPRRRTQVEGSQEESVTPIDGIAELTGMVVHGYRLVECIGRGRSADVFRAEHEVLRHQAAVKIFRAVEDGERALRQAQALASMWHPSFVAATDSGLLPDGRRFVVTELVRGRTLDQLGKIARPMPLVAQIAAALAEAHRHGLVHRGLSLANVMSGDNDVVKVLGFGSVKMRGAGALTETLGLRGDPTYFAPEQFAAPSDCGPSADIYALGVIAFALLEGKPPFTGSREQLEKAHRTRTTPSLARHGPLGRLVERMLAKDPKRRPTAVEVGTELRALIDAKPRVQTKTVALLMLASAIGTGAVVTIALRPRASEPVERTEVAAAAPPPPVAPVAIVPGIEAEEEEEAPPPIERSTVRKAKKRAPRTEDERDLTALLRARHLARSDLAADPVAAQLLDRAQMDPHAFQELARAADRIARQPAVAERKLEAAGRELSTLGDRVEITELRELETEYFELRRSYRPSLDGDAAVALLARIDAFRRKLPR